MNQQRAFAWGQCKNLSGKRSLAESLQLKGLKVDERSYSIVIRDCECFTIEFDSQSEVESSIEGTAAALQTLVADVELVATALQAADITFWIEITDAVQNPLHYVHNKCPEC